MPYFPLSDEIIRQIVVMQLEKICTRVRDTYRATFDWDPQLVETIAGRCTESASGARNVDIPHPHVVARTFRHVLARLADGEPIRSVHAGLKSDGLFFFAINKL